MIGQHKTETGDATRETLPQKNHARGGNGGAPGASAAAAALGGGVVVSEDDFFAINTLKFKFRDSHVHGCQMAKFDPFLSLDCATVEGMGAQSKERK